MILTCQVCGKHFSDKMPRCPGCRTRVVGGQHGTQTTLNAARPDDDLDPTYRKEKDKFLAGKQQLPLDPAGEVGRAMQFARDNEVTLDVTIASVATADVLIAQKWGPRGHGHDDPAWRPSPEQYADIITYGCYLGETLCLSWDGVWRASTVHKKDPMRMDVVFPKGQRATPMTRVWERIQHGAALGLWRFCTELAEQIGHRPGEVECKQWLTQATNWMMIQRFDLAISFVDQALKACPQDPDSWLARAQALQRLGKIDEALRAYLNLREIGVPDREVALAVDQQIELLRMG